MESRIELLATPLPVAEAISWVQHPEAGAVVPFIGHVRRQTHGQQVIRLEYEAYAPMALKELQRIADEVGQAFPIQRLAVLHRTGVLGIGQVAVVIAVSTPHRAEAFAACRQVIEQLKARVPIWKKEVGPSGEVWVSARP